MLQHILLCCMKKEVDGKCLLQCQHWYDALCCLDAVFNRFMEIVDGCMKHWGLLLLGLLLLVLEAL